MRKIVVKIICACVCLGIMQFPITIYAEEEIKIEEQTIEEDPSTFLDENAEGEVTLEIEEETTVQVDTVEDDGQETIVEEDRTLNDGEKIEETIIEENLEENIAEEIVKSEDEAIEAIEKEKEEDEIIEESIEKDAVEVEKQNLPNTPAYQFVSRLYNTCLGRKPDAKGATHWVNRLESRAMSATQLLDAFYFSNEFKAKTHTNTQLVDSLYRTMLERSATTSENQYWRKYLDDGLTIEYIIYGFTYSKEFTALCNRYGIRRGEYYLTDIRDAHEGTTRFIGRLYRICLGRIGEADGVLYWVRELVNGRQSAASLVKNFFESTEFEQKNLSNKDLLIRLYQSLFDREADATGMNFWVSYLNAGISKRYILAQFVQSNEFIALCNRYGVYRGSLALSEYRDLHVKEALLVGTIAYLLEGYVPSGAYVDEGARKIVHKTVKGVDLVTEILVHKAYTNRKLNATEKVNLFSTIFNGRNATKAELNEYVAYINTGASDDYLVREMLDSSYFTKRCKEVGIEVGTIELTQYRDLNVDMAKYLGDIYKATTGSISSGDKLEERVKAVVNGELLSKVVAEILAEAVFSNNLLSTSEKVDKSYRAITGSAPTKSKLNAWKTKIDELNVYEELIEELTLSDAFQNKCSSLKQDATPYYSGLSTLKEKKLTVGGKTITVLADNKGVIVKNDVRTNGYFYQVDAHSGAIIHKQELPNHEKVYMQGIDISTWQGNFDLTDYKDGFVIIRLGYARTLDTRAKRNMDLCEKLDIPYGVYLYSYATSVEEARLEAEFTIKNLAGRNIEMGVWYDMEDESIRPLGSNMISKMCKTYCDRVSEAGYHVGIYANLNWFTYYIKDCDEYDKWLAAYGRDDGNYHGDYSDYAVIHQYTSVDNTGKQPHGLDKNYLHYHPILLKN